MYKSFGPTSSFRIQWLIIRDLAYSIAVNEFDFYSSASLVSNEFEIVCTN